MIKIRAEIMAVIISVMLGLAAMNWHGMRGDLQSLIAKVDLIQSKQTDQGEAIARLEGRK